MKFILNGSSIIIDLPIDITKTLKQKNYSQDRLFITTELPTTCLDQTDQTSKLDLDFEFSYDINAKIIGSEKEHILKDNRRTKFKHVYEIEGGPSPTDKVVPFFLYVPSNLNASTNDIEIKPKNVVPTCKTQQSIDGVQTRITKEGDPMETCGGVAEGGTCTVFRCELKKGFGMGKDKKVSVTINMKFTPDENTKKIGRKFLITTALKVEENEKFVLTRSSFVAQDFTVEALLEYWPIAVGMLIVLIIFIVVLYIMYKSNSFNKLRFTKNAMEAKAEKERTQSDEEQSKLIS